MRINAKKAAHLVLIGAWSSVVLSEPIKNVKKSVVCAQDNLLRALQNTSRVADSKSFCSAYISIPATSTVTVYTSTSTLESSEYVYKTVHPMWLYNLQRMPYDSPYPPLVYNTASPSPIPVPGNPQSYGSRFGKVKRNDNEVSERSPDSPRPIHSPEPTPPPELVGRGEVPLPSYIASSYPPSRISSACSCLSVSAAETSTLYTYSYTRVITTTCTSFYASPTATYPAFCAPSLQVNAPNPSTHAQWRVVPRFASTSKMDCCASCAANFNCAWWKFDFGVPGDGWAAGTCHFAYYIGNSTDRPGRGDGTPPAICPNGQTYGIPEEFAYRYTGSNAANDRPGYNPGPCGYPLNNFQSEQDFGYPDNYQDRMCR